MHEADQAQQLGDLNTEAPTNATTNDSQVLDPLIGMVIDNRYTIDARIARGGMATVYLAHDQRLDRPVALKVMHPYLAESVDFVQRFRREARAAARILHPGVVSVYDQGVIHGQGYLVMELVDGTTLRSLLTAQGTFTVEQALRYTCDVLEALRAAHRVGVIHRDIKPENVLVPTEGTVKVTDFGLARAASEVSMSTTGSMLGTVAYVAPEVASSNTADARTDLYAAGIMLVEMITGRIPWAGESPLQIAHHHVSDDVPLPSAEVDWLPREIDDLVAALTARDPNERLGSAQDAIDATQRVIAAIPDDIAQRRADRPESTMPSTGTKTTAIVVDTLTANLPAQIQTTSQAVVHASGATSAVATEGKGRRRRAPKIIAALIILIIVASLGGWWWWSEYGPGSYLTMPETTGRSTTAVQSDLQAMGLGVVIEEEFSDDVPKGKIITSDPEGGAPVHKRADVRLVSSKGVDMKVVPDVVGQTRQQATTALTDAGLVLGNVAEEYSEDVKSGHVISQKVKAKSSVPHDTSIDIVLSKGREPIGVPKIVGTEASAAKKTLEDLGLVASSSEAFSDTVPEGTIISQEPEAATTLHRGDTVSYVVSKGPELVTVPNVVGKQRDEAISILEAAGLKVEVHNVLGGVFGTSRYTDPDAGTSVRKGSTIALYVV
ncbi:Stk1 family PASTA domain-containing Ser/Thr kinase [Schaalia sp. ZJ405]|nr:Stk1 family PASTA domain-containing Ser/Thr kinase [Schaalia sp. ZJ405]